MSVRASSRFSVSSAEAGRGSTRPRAAKPRRLLAGLLAAALLTLPAAAGRCLGAETNALAAAPSQVEVTNTEAILLHSLMQLQEQLHATQLAIEQNRQEIKQSAIQHAEALSTALQTIQDNFTAQRARDLEAMEQHNKVVLILVSAFAAMGFLTMLMMSYFQWRMSKGLAEISAALPVALGLDHGPTAAALRAAGPSNATLIGAGLPQQQRSKETELNLRPAAKVTGAGSAAAAPAFPDPDTAFRRRQFRALRTAVIVGLICAAALALLFYFVSYRKLGFGYLHTWFKM